MDDWDEIVRDAGEDNTSDGLSDAEVETLLTPKPPVVSGSAGQTQSPSNLQDPTSKDAPPEPEPDNDVDSDGKAADTAASTAGQDDNICRICFSGAEEEQELGRLISPCLCRGTMSKVHVSCLNSWRNVSQSRTSFFQCDQCKYNYRIKRAKIAGLAENRAALVSLALTFFLALVTINGLIGNWLLHQARSDDGIISTIFFDGPYSDDISYSSFPYRDAYLPLEAVGQAVDFASKVVSEKVGNSFLSDIVVEDDDDVEERASTFFSSSLFSKGSTGSAARHKKSRKTKLQDSIMVRVEYEDEEGNTAYRMVRQKKSRKIPRLPARIVTFFKDAIAFFAVGISMTGIGSFLWLILTLPLWPLHPLRNGLFRSFRGTREGRNGGGASPFGTILLVIFVIVGLIKSVHMCWKLTNNTAKMILRRAEMGILEVGR